ncbi:outer membrane porin HofQ [Gimesia panareensis]|nr:outer membrane porin HofQ [Gimesia panareensis]
MMTPQKNHNQSWCSGLKEGPTLGKAFGVLACTTLIAASMWLANLGNTTRKVAADVESNGQSISGRQQRSARYYLSLGTQYYERGQFAEAVEALEKASVSPGRLSQAEFRKMNEYLGRARSRAAAPRQRQVVRAQSPAADSGFSAGYTNAEGKSLEEKKQLARQLLQSAREDIKLNEFAKARRKAGQAASLRLEYGPFDQRPEQILAEIARAEQRQQKSSPIQQAGGFTQNNSGVMQVAAVEESAEGNPFGNSSGNPFDGTQTRKLTEKEQAVVLLKQARQSLKSGNYDDARTLALQAQDYDVAYQLFEDRPQHILAEIERKTGAKIFAGQSKPSMPVAQSGPASSSKDQAARLLKQARTELKSGNLDSARELAQQASQLDVAYRLFDDRPELVLDEIKRAQSVGSLAANTGSRPQMASGNTAAGGSKAQATDLLRLARLDIKKRDFESARQKVAQVQQMKVSYDLFDDRPELVLAAIDRISDEAATISGMKGLQQNQDAVRPRVNRLMEQAKLALQQGNKDEALMLASSAHKLAQTLDLKFTPDAESPEDFIRRVGTASDTRLNPGNTSNDAKSNAEYARRLLASAREDLSKGRVQEARQKAEAAQEVDTAYSLFEDRPEQLLADIRKMAGQPGGLSQEEMYAAETERKKQFSQKLVAQARTDLKAGRFESARVNAQEALKVGSEFKPGEDSPQAILRDLESNMGSQTAQVASQKKNEASEIAVIHPGASALELYNLGMQRLAEGDRGAAYQAFLAAYQSGEKLDTHRAQQLQDAVRELAPSRADRIRLVKNQTATDTPGVAAEQPSTIDLVEQKQAIEFSRLRSEVLNAIFKAERLRESAPTEALGVIDQAMSKVENSSLNKKSTQALIGSLQRTRTSIDSFRKQVAPLEELKKQNEEVEDYINRRIKNKIRVEQELADLVEKFNELVDQRRYAEAEVVAKQAKDLDPQNPVTVTMEWKAKFLRRDASNNAMRDRKEQNTWDQLNDVEEALADAYTPDIKFGRDAKEWAELTKRREKYHAKNHNQKTEREIQIEESLDRPVNLSFEAEPLSNVMNKIQGLTGINIFLDSLGLEEEGVTTDAPVTINVNGIKLRSALNLLLEPLNLSYTIDNEVLKITSRIRQQGTLRTETYPVADLVVPIPNFAANGSMASNPYSQMGAVSYNSGIGGNQSTPGNFQVADPLAGGVPGANPWAGNAPTAKVAGGGSNIDFDSLTELIVSTVEPDSWEEIGGAGSVRPFETTLSLVIRQTQKVHDEIANLLEQLRRLQDLQVTIEVRFVTVSDRFFERIGVDFDFNVADTLGGPTVDNSGNPLPAFGQVNLLNSTNQNGGGGNNNNNNQGQQGQQGQNTSSGQTGGQGVAPFSNPPTRTLINTNNFPKKGTVIGMSAPDSFTPDLDVQFRQGSFEIGVPEFGSFNANAGVNVGLAILSDIEAFFFINAAQADERSNLMFAPKVTLFNGQVAFVTSNVSRPFVISLVPTVGNFSVGFTPVIANIPEGVSLTVSAVISADRRYVRLSVNPNFTNVTDVFTFSFQGGAGGGQQGQQGGQLGQQGGGQLGQQGGGNFGNGVGAGLGGIGGIGGGGGNTGGGGFGQTGQQGQQGQQGQNGGGGLGTTTIQQPVVEQVTVTTTVSVPDGGTVLLGGVKRLREGRSMAGVPILNKLPYVSRLFKNTGVGRETESLMMMVTPRIIIQEEEEEALLGY